MTAGPDRLLPYFLKHENQVLISELIKLLGLLWAREESPRALCEPVIMQNYEERKGSLSENHREISSISLTSRLLTCIILQRLYSIH